MANIVSRFVCALLPDKRPTFSMADAVTTLQQGTGDCTEHSVLFAALMRAHGVPTRLVAGLYLAPGGYWVYHMWATYWDGAAWRQIDPVSADPPGALYVAIGRGATRFTDVRPDVSAFLERTFSGVSFDLVSASSDGESLKLSYPRTPGGTSLDAATFNAAVRAVMGDAEGALAALDASMSADTATVTARLFRAELLVELGRFDAAIDELSLFDSEQIRFFLKRHLGEAKAEETVAFIERTYGLRSLAPRWPWPVGTSQPWASSTTRSHAGWRDVTPGSGPPTYPAGSR